MNDHISSKSASPHLPGPEWEESASRGFDVSLLEYTLRLTPEQRIRFNDSSLNLIDTLLQRSRKLSGGLGQLLECVVRSGFEFVLIGGMAAAAHGAEDVESKLELCAPLDGENLAKLHDALKPFRPVQRIPRGVPFAGTGLLHGPPSSLFLLTDLGALDLVIEVAGVGSYPEVKKKSFTRKLGFGDIRLMNLESLIASEETTGGSYHLGIASQLKALRTKLN